MDSSFLDLFAYSDYYLKESVPSQVPCALTCVFSFRILHLLTLPIHIFRISYLAVFYDWKLIRKSLKLIPLLFLEERLLSLWRPMTSLVRLTADWLFETDSFFVLVERGIDFMYSKFKNVRLLTFFAYGDYSLYCKKTGADSFSNSRKAFQQSKERPLYSSKPLLPGLVRNTLFYWFLFSN